MKPKAPRWLTQAFADGVDEEYGRPDSPHVQRVPSYPGGFYPGAFGRCFLAQHDERSRPCSGRLERAHLIPRQRVENAMWAMLHDATFSAEYFTCSLNEEIWSLILLAAWDPRNAVIGCEGHHRRLDNHGTPALVIPAPELPDHMLDFIFDWGLETQAEDRFPNFIRY